MKITLLKSTFYFNDPVNLTPRVKDITVGLDTLEDNVVRKLNLGITTGVIAITEGLQEFQARVATFKKAVEPVKKEQTVEAVPVVEEVVKETITEPAVEKEATEDETQEDATTTKKKVVPAKKTTTTKKV